MSRFDDDGFKIYLTLFMWSERGFQKALQAAVRKAEVDPDDPEMNDGVARFLLSYPLEQKWLDSIASLGSPDARALQAAVPGWDGEAPPYQVHEWADLKRLENLEEFQWPDSGPVPASAIPEHPRLKKIKLPTDYYGTKGAQNNQPAFDALIARGFAIESQQKHGTTTLVRE